MCINLLIFSVTWYHQHIVEVEREQSEGWAIGGPKWRRGGFPSQSQVHDAPSLPMSPLFLLVNQVTSTIRYVCHVVRAF